MTCFKVSMKEGKALNTSDIFLHGEAKDYMAVSPVPFHWGALSLRTVPENWS